MSDLNSLLDDLLANLAIDLGFLGICLPLQLRDNQTRQDRAETIMHAGSSTTPHHVSSSVSAA